MQKWIIIVDIITTGGKKLDYFEGGEKYRNYNRLHMASLTSCKLANATISQNMGGPSQTLLSSPLNGSPNIKFFTYLLT